MTKRPFAGKRIEELRFALRECAEQEVTIHVEHIPLDAKGYSRVSKRYWGWGAPVYYVWAILPKGNVLCSTHTRSPSRGVLRTELKGILPLAKVLR